MPGVRSPDPEQAAEVLDDALAAGPRGRRRQGAGRALRRRPARQGVAEGQAGAHPRPGRPRRRVGVRPPHREAVEHPPRRPRPRRRRAGDGGQDVQGHDRRAARVADRGRSPSSPASSPTGACCCGRSSSSRSPLDGAQRSTRYPGGVALRFARVLRYRPDKTAGRGRHRSTPSARCSPAELTARPPAGATSVPSSSMPRSRSACASRGLVICSEIRSTPPSCPETRTSLLGDRVGVAHEEGAVRPAGGVELGPRRRGEAALAGDLGRTSRASPGRSCRPPPACSRRRSRTRAAPPAASPARARPAPRPAGRGRPAGRTGAARRR